MRTLAIVVLTALHLVLVLWSWGATAHAAGGRASRKDPCLRDRSCRHHIEQASILSSVELEEYALAEYQAAYAVRKMPWLLFNIARLLHRLNRLDEAIPYYQRYLDKAPKFEAEQSVKAQTYLAQARQDVALSRGPKPAPISLPIVAAPPPKRSPEPVIYKQPWLWTTVAILSGVVAVGVAGGVMAATRSSANASPIPPGWPIFRPF